MTTIIRIGAAIILLLTASCATDDTNSTKPYSEANLHSAEVKSRGDLNFGNSIPPTPIGTQTPIYPPELKAAGITGIVVIEFVVYKNGGVDNIDIIRSPHPKLSRAVIKYIKESKYRPGLKNGKPSNMKIRQSIRFDLEDIKPQLPS